MTPAPLVVVLAAGVRLAFGASPYAPEPAACARYTLTRSAAGDTLTVTALDAAAVQWATPLAVAFTCPAGTLPVHGHTGAWCSVNLWTCAFPGGPLPCAESAQDRRALALEPARPPAGVVVCRDGRAVAFTADAPEGP